MGRIFRRSLGLAFGGGLMLLAATTPYAGQTPVPVNGTMALDGQVDATYKALNTIMVKTSDGVRHLFHLTSKTEVHGEESADEDPLGGLKAGSTVAVHYTSKSGEDMALEVDRVGENGLKTIEGVVIRVDRPGRKITIRLADGTEETLRLTKRAAADAGKDLDRAGSDSTRVAVYYSDAEGRAVVHYFKKVS